MDRLRLAGNLGSEGAVAPGGLSENEGNLRTNMAEPARPLGTDDADDLRLYLEAAAREPLLTKEEEVMLAMTIEKGKEAEDRIKAGRLRSDRSIMKARADIRQAEAARQRFIMANP